MKKRALLTVFALVAGCAPSTPSTPPVVGSQAPLSSPSPTLSPSASVWPTPSTNPIPSGALTALLYDEEGRRLTGAKVRVVSLNPSNPFDATVDAPDGQAVVKEAPMGVSLQITASKPGWTARTRVEVLVPATETTFYFGHPNDLGQAREQDPEGATFALSNYPEVASVEPAPDQPATTLTQVKVTLSEPLDSINQARFARALRILPANTEATPGLSAPRDITGQEGVDLPTTAWPYEIKEGTSFDDAFETRASVSWDPTGQVATFTLPAPLLASARGNANYQVVLAATANSMIVDAEGLPLGTNAEGKRGQYPLADGTIIENAFLKPSLTGDASPTETTEQRWNRLHAPSLRFSIAEDDSPPKLAAVTVESVEGDTVFTLRFNEPLAAFNGTKEGQRDPGLGNLGHYTFVVGPSSDEVRGAALDGEGTNALTGDTTDFDGHGELQLGPAAGNPITVELDPTRPEVLRLTIENNTRLFAAGIRAIKMRVEDVMDPAGNKLEDEAADAAAIVGTIQGR